MLKNNKISQYKIKKILKYFVDDYTSTKTSKCMKLNRKTIDRYYKSFRKTFRLLLIDIIKDENIQENYIGYIKGKYGPKCYLNVYKLDDNFFLITKLIGKPNFNEKMLQCEDFEKFRNFVHQRFSKFHGLAEKNYYCQIIESSFKYAYNQDELFDLIWNQFKKYSCIDILSSI